MKKKMKYRRVIVRATLQVATVVCVLNFFFFPRMVKISAQENNVFAVSVDGEEIGIVSDLAMVDGCLQEARKILATESTEMVFTDAQVTYEGQAHLFGVTTSEEELTHRMVAILRNNIRQTRSKSYTIKINEFTINLAKSEEVVELLQAALYKYDEAKQYKVNLVPDKERELNVITTEVVELENEEKEQETDAQIACTAGVERRMAKAMLDMDMEADKDFSDYELGLTSIEFGDEIEIVESYLTKEEITDLSSAIEIVTKDQEKNTIYEVVSGDTLSGISLKTDIPVDKLIDLNENLETENSVIRVGDELIITIPEPELSVERTEDVYYEEDYDAAVEYIYNDSWYTTESEVRQEPSSGHRKVLKSISYRNQAVVQADIIKEEVTLEAVPKIVEIGTKTPPTYIKPLSGGRFTSGFKKRWGRMHKGVDWATPVGTAIMASSGGTVARAGWASGYGYVVYINHSDGRQTRYGHLSKILVKAGQSVKQGEKIALSGNTGRSTGPHVHFEILINGAQVDPLKHMN